MLTVDFRRLPLQGRELVLDAGCGEGQTKSSGWWGASYLRRYLAAKLARSEGDVYVAVMVQAQSAQYTGQHYLGIVETKPMQTGMVEVDAAYLKDELGRKTLIREVSKRSVLSAHPFRATRPRGGGEAGAG